jgi:uncharacterized membrane protein
MSKVHAESTRIIPASPQEVYSALIDYQEKRPSILTPNFLDYSVEQGGTGDGTLIRYRLQAGGRERAYRMRVAESIKGQTLTEKDTNSSLTTTWTVLPLDEGQKSLVYLETEWEGGSGVGGFFEKTFAPLGLQSIYNAMLTQLAELVRPNSTALTTPKNPAETALKTAALGFVCGVRSTTPFALLSWTSNPSSESADGPLASPISKPVTAASLLGEMIMDKLPITPARVSPGPFIGRLVFGSVAGILMYRRANQPVALGAIIGAAGAAAGAAASYYSRKWLTDNTSVPGPVWGLVEDAVVLGLGSLVVSNSTPLDE